MAGSMFKALIDIVYKPESETETWDANSGGCSAYRWQVCDGI